MLKAIFLLIIFFNLQAIATTAAYEQACSSKMLDLRKLGPVRNQSDVGWCYAFAAADMATYYLGQRVSAVDIAANFISRDPVTGSMRNTPGLSGERIMHWSASNGTYEGGIIGAALAGENDRGFCSENLVRSDNFPDYTKVDETLGQFTKAIFDFDRRLNNMDGKLNNKVCRDGGVAIRAIFPKGNIKDIVNILNQYDYDQSWRVMTDAVCEGNRTKLPANFKVRVNNGDRNSQLSQIDKALNSGDIVGIGYDYAKLVYDTTGTVISRWYSPAPAQGGHASTVVGRRFNPRSKTCEYAIRNTAGAYCDPGFTREQCHDGYMWVEKENLLTTILSVTYIQK